MFVLKHLNMNKLKMVRLRKDTTLTIRVNSLLKDHIQNKVENNNQTLTEFLTNLVCKELNINETQLTRQALGN